MYSGVGAELVDVEMEYGVKKCCGTVATTHGHSLPLRTLCGTGVNFMLAWHTFIAGVCFVDYTTPAPPGSGSLSRIHRVTLGQFNDIVVQENSGNAAAALPLRTLARLTSEGPGARSRLSHGWYGTVVYLGELEGLPLLTFSCCEEQLGLHPTPPSDAYLAVIMRGLAQCKVPGHTAVQYLMERAAAAEELDGGSVDRRGGSNGGGGGDSGGGDAGGGGGGDGGGDGGTKEGLWMARLRAIANETHGHWAEN